MKKNEETFKINEEMVDVSLPVLEEEIIYKLHSTFYFYLFMITSLLYFILAEDESSVQYLKDLINNSYLSLAGPLI